MKYWLAYFLAIAISTSVLPILAQKSVVGQAEQTITVSKNGEITEIALDEYLLSAMITQSNGIENIEALKSLAVAIRSVAISCSLYGCKHSDFALCDDSNCCIALGNTTDIDESRLTLLSTACEETRGEILTLGSTPAMALFCRCASKGTEESAEYPYLVSVSESEKCEIHKLELEMDIDDELTDKIGNIEEEAPYLVYNDNEKCILAIINKKTIDGRDLQNALSLPSNEFVFAVDDERLIITSHGIGHGYGLNLCGAERMANDRFDYKSILAFYFPKLKINKIG